MERFLWFGEGEGIGLIVMWRSHAGGRFIWKNAYEDRNRATIVEMQFALSIGGNVRFVPVIVARGTGERDTGVVSHGQQARSQSQVFVLNIAWLARGKPVRAVYCLQTGSRCSAFSLAQHIPTVKLPPTSRLEGVVIPRKVHVGHATEKEKKLGGGVLAMSWYAFVVY